MPTIVMTIERPGGAPTPPARDRSPQEGPMAQNATRRPRGTGRVYIRLDKAGRETYYGTWWTEDGSRPNRVLGLVRTPGLRDGLTKTQAEKRLRELMQSA